VDFISPILGVEDNGFSPSLYPGMTGSFPVRRKLVQSDRAGKKTCNFSLGFAAAPGLPGQEVANLANENGTYRRGTRYGLRGQSRQGLSIEVIFPEEGRLWPADLGENTAPPVIPRMAGKCTVVGKSVSDLQ
jgi:hypothetical protein